MAKAFFRIIIYVFLFTGFSHSISAQTLAAVKRGEKWYYIDKSGNVVISQLYEAVGDKFTDGLAPVKLKGKWGYINTSGKMLIKNKFTEAYGFNKGFALVKEESKYIVINRSGKTISRFDDWDIAIDTVAENIPMGKTKDGNFFIIPSAGKIRQFPYSQYSEMEPFSNGLARVKQNGKYGFIDTSGQLKIACIYDDASRFSDNISCVRNGVVYSAIDKNGDRIQELMHLDDMGVFTKNKAPLRVNGRYVIYTLGYGEQIKTDLLYGDASPSVYVYPFYNGAARFFSYPLQDRVFKFGYLLEDGKILHAFQYEWANDFSEGLAAVKENGTYGYINIKGEIIIPFMFDEAHNFYPVK